MILYSCVTRLQNKADFGLGMSFSYSLLFSFILLCCVKRSWETFLGRIFFPWCLHMSDTWTHLSVYLSIYPSIYLCIMWSVVGSPAGVLCQREHEVNPPTFQFLYQLQLEVLKSSWRLSSRSEESENKICILIWLQETWWDANSQST